MVSTPSLISNPIAAILSGPTATGKTAIALELARKYSDIEIINADSLLVYSQMNIGTAKPSASELQEIKHHLIDVREPSEVFTAGDYVKLVNAAFAEIMARSKRPLLVGGSGFYLKALIYGLWEGPPGSPEVRAAVEKSPSPDLYSELFNLDEESALRIGVNDRYRLVRAIELYRLTGKTPSQLQTEQNKAPDPRFHLMVIDRASDELFSRIAERTRLMLHAADHAAPHSSAHSSAHSSPVATSPSSLNPTAKCAETPADLISEVKLLRELYPESRALTAVGYAQVCAFLDGVKPAGRNMKDGLEGLQSEIELATRQLVKRQRTWFRSEKSASLFELERDREKLLSELEKIYG